MHDALTPADDRGVRDVLPSPPPWAQAVVAGLELWPVAALLAVLGLHEYVLTPRRLARRADLLAEPPLRPPPPA